MNINELMPIPPLADLQAAGNPPKSSLGVGPWGPAPNPVQKTKSATPTTTPAAWNPVSPGGGLPPVGPLVDPFNLFGLNPPATGTSSTTSPLTHYVLLVVFILLLGAGVFGLILPSFGIEPGDVVKGIAKTAGTAAEAA